jgi:pimeloyl-ACP methyl ester carboxylesterase
VGNERGAGEVACSPPSAEGIQVYAALEYLQERRPMQNVRTYGKAPFSVAVIHGGPGAGGEMAPVARELAYDRGVMEPIQTATSLHGQVEELRRVLENHGDIPAILMGFSWGAWLSFIVTARYPALVKKLLLVGSGPFEAQYVSRLQETRLRRLSEEDRREFTLVIRALGHPATEDKDIFLARLKAFAAKTDMYDPITTAADASDVVGGQGAMFYRVWQAAAALRSNGELLALAKRIQCPVVAIHGDYDPHPAAGVHKPLSRALADFRFILLEQCGHTPWLERSARERFYRIIKAELL